MQQCIPSGQPLESIQAVLQQLPLYETIEGTLVSVLSGGLGLAAYKLAAGQQEENQHQSHQKQHQEQAEMNQRKLDPTTSRQHNKRSAPQTYKAGPEQPLEHQFATPQPIPSKTSRAAAIPALTPPSPPSSSSSSSLSASVASSAYPALHGLSTPYSISSQYGHRYRHGQSSEAANAQGMGNTPDSWSMPWSGSSSIAHSLLSKSIGETPTEHNYFLALPPVLPDSFSQSQSQSHTEEQGNTAAAVAANATTTSDSADAATQKSSQDNYPYQYATLSAGSSVGWASASLGSIHSIGTNIFTPTYSQQPATNTTGAVEGHGSIGGELAVERVCYALKPAPAAATADERADREACHPDPSNAEATTLRTTALAASPPQYTAHSSTYLGHTKSNLAEYPLSLYQHQEHQQHQHDHEQQQHHNHTPMTPFTAACVEFDKNPIFYEGFLAEVEVEAGPFTNTDTVVEAEAEEMEMVDELEEALFSSCGFSNFFQPATSESYHTGTALGQTNTSVEKGSSKRSVATHAPGFSAKHGTQYTQSADASTRGTSNTRLCYSSYGSYTGEEENDAIMGSTPQKVTKTHVSSAGYLLAPPNFYGAIDTTAAAGDIDNDQVDGTVEGEDLTHHPAVGPQTKTGYTSPAWNHQECLQKSGSNSDQHYWQDSQTEPAHVTESQASTLTSRSAYNFSDPSQSLLVPSSATMQQLGGKILSISEWDRMKKHGRSSDDKGIPAGKDTTSGV